MSKTTRYEEILNLMSCIPFDQRCDYQLLYQLASYSRLNNSKFNDLMWLVETCGRALVFGCIYDKLEDMEMAKKDMWTFAEVRLTDDDRPAFTKFCQQDGHDHVWSIIEMATMGYKLSISWIDKQNAFVVTVTGSDRSKLNRGVSMTSWSDDVLEAIMLTAFKVLIYTENGDWLEYAKASQTWG